MKLKFARNLSNVWVPGLILLFFVSCEAKRGSNGFTNSDDIKFTQYMIEGERLYKANCSNCHQHDGNGLGKLFPPLNGSDYMKENFEKSICIIKNGMKGEITVNGQIYNQVMPANPRLTNLEIAEIATYIYNKWTQKKGLISVTEINKILNSCNEPQP